MQATTATIATIETRPVERPDKRSPQIDKAAPESGKKHINLISVLYV